MVADRIQTCSAIPEPTRYPGTPMKVYGTIPGRPDEPLFRIVYAPTVMGLVGGEFTNPETGGVEFIGYQPRAQYSHIGDKWIMEKWVSAFEFTKQTEAEYYAQWKAQHGLCLTGPYPVNGAYQWVWTFNKPEQIGAAGIVAAVGDKAKFNSQSANSAALKQAQKAAKQAKFNQNFDKMKDSQRAFGIRAANIGGMVKAQKSFRELQAPPSHLPTRGAKLLKPSVEQLEVAGF